MDTALVKAALLAGPRVLGRRPLSFLAWVAVRLAKEYVTLAILLGAELGGAVSGVGSAWAVLAGLPFEAVLISAVLRAHLKPEARAFAGLRLGLAESRMAGLLVLAYLVGAVIALPASIAAAYVAIGLHQKILAQSVLAIGALVAALVLMRFAPAPAILVDTRRVDLPLAWRSSRGRYVLLAVVVVGAAAIERALGPQLPGLSAPPELASWSALLAPSRLLALAWRSLIGVAALTVMAGGVAAVWRRARAD